MSSFNENITPTIPSEMLEPITQKCIGDWIEMLGTGSKKMSAPEFRTLLRALWWVASTSKAIHCELAIGNFQGIVDSWSDEQLVKFAKEAYSNLYKERMAGV